MFVAAVGATVVGAITGRDALQLIGKPLIAPALAVRVVRARADLDRTDTALLLVSLGAATVGDCYLIDPDDDRRLVRGATWFGGMQLAYTVLWLRRGARVTAPAALPRAVGWLAASLAMRARSAKVAAPLMLYGLTLASATSLAADPALAPAATVRAGLAVPDADPASRLGLGALLFTVSDALIVLRRLFVRRERDRRLVEGVILATYACAQFLLADPRVGRKTLR